MSKATDKAKDCVTLLFVGTLIAALLITLGAVLAEGWGVPFVEGSHGP